MKPMLIILEGPDAVGKTTLALHLAQRFNAMYFHATCSRSLIPAMLDYHRSIMKNVEANIAIGRSVVLDRFWPSELLYGGITRPNDHYGMCYIDLRDRCTALNAIYVVCSSPHGTDRHARNRDVTHAYTDEVYARISRAYDDFWRCHCGDMHFINYVLERDGGDMNKFASLLQDTHAELLTQRFIE